MKIEFQYTEEELSNEIWMPIPEYEEIYEASSLGRIRTKEGKVTFTELHGARHWDQKILSPKWCSCTKNKRRFDGRVELWKNGFHKTYLVARLVIAAFDKSFGLHDRNITVNHIDNNSLNNRIENLEWCTRKENIQKGFKSGCYRCKKVKIISKETGEERMFYSMSEASRFLSNGISSQYIFEKTKRKSNQFENSQYRWEILN